VNQRGLALPAALIALAIVTTLLLAFAFLSSTEPVIAANHDLTARARTFAESGLEQALWALSHPGVDGGLLDPLPNSPAPAPYDGMSASFRPVALAGGVPQGGFVVLVSHAASGRLNERSVSSIGYVPDATRPRARKRLDITAMRLKRLDPPCAVCIGGEAPEGTASALRLGDGVTVDGSDRNGGAAYCGTSTPTSAVRVAGTVDTTGTPNIVAPAGGAAIEPAASPSSASPFMLADADIETLKVLARARGTYYRGSQTFTAAPPHGLVFVDTPSGRALNSSSPMSDLIEVHASGTWTVAWRGWLVVAGNLRVTGQVDVTGLLYAQNSVALGPGEGRVRGAVIAANRVDTTSNTLDGNGSSVTYDCPAVRSGGGTLSEHWFIRPGSYSEVAG
jgi:hypothetical protein